MSALAIFGVVLIAIGLLGFIGSLVFANWASKQRRCYFTWVWAAWTFSMLLMVAVGPFVVNLGWDA